MKQHVKHHVYRVVKVTERKYLIAREGIGDVLMTVAEAKSEFLAKMVVDQLNCNSATREQSTAAEVLKRVAEGMRKESVVG